MFDFSIPLWADVLLFFLAAAVIGTAGTKAAKFADQLADRTGLGEAITGTVFLGLITALPGLAASIAAAYKGHPALAISNAMGGIAVQTVALAGADLAHRPANLEHAAASAANMMQAIMLIMLMTLVLAGMSSPHYTLGSVHPMTILLFITAAGAFWLVFRTRKEPMWEPTQTDQTVPDLPNPDYERSSLKKVATLLIVTATITSLAGVLVAETAENIMQETDLNEAVVGGLLMAIATSLPELVTSVAAVRQGALTLAVSDIVGGNFFDVLFVAAADLAYLQGSLYHAGSVGDRERFLTAFTILINIVLLVGLIHRQRRGPANIGFESVLMIVVYIAGFLTISLLM